MTSSPWTARRIIFLGLVGGIAAAALTVGVRMMYAHVDEDDAGHRDAQRFSDLQALADTAVEIARKDGRLPQSLDELREKAGHPLQFADPQTFEIYGYRVVDGGKIEVCATFEQRAAGQDAGRNCMTLDPAAAP